MWDSQYLLYSDHRLNWKYNYADRNMLFATFTVTVDNYKVLVEDDRNNLLLHNAFLHKVWGEEAYWFWARESVWVPQAQWSDIIFSNCENGGRFHRYSACNPLFIFYQRQILQLSEEYVNNRHQCGAAAPSSLDSTQICSFSTFFFYIAPLGSSHPFINYQSLIQFMKADWHWWKQSAGCKEQGLIKFSFFCYSSPPLFSVLFTVLSVIMNNAQDWLF